jgi:hypothetical protein
VLINPHYTQNRFGGQGLTASNIRPQIRRDSANILAYEARRDPSLAAGALQLLQLQRRYERLALVMLAVHVSIWIMASGGFLYAVELARAYGLAYWGSWTLLLESLLLPVLSVLSGIAWGAFVSDDSKGFGTRSAETV